MRALGAELTLVPSEDGRTTKKLILDMIEKARELSREPNTFWSDQLQQHRLDRRLPRARRGDLVADPRGVDAFVQCVGTGPPREASPWCSSGTILACSIVAVEPGESSVLLGGAPGPHKIEGVGIGYTPPLWEPLAHGRGAGRGHGRGQGNDARRLAREEALFAGTSSGANVVAAIRVAQRLGPGHKVVTLMCDSGLKYTGHRRLSLGLTGAPRLTKPPQCESAEASRSARRHPVRVSSPAPAPKEWCRATSRLVTLRRGSRSPTLSKLARHRCGDQRAAHSRVVLRVVHIEDIGSARFELRLLRARLGVLAAHACGAGHPLFFERREPLARAGAEADRACAASGRRHARRPSSSMARDAREHVAPPRRETIGGQ